MKFPLRILQFLLLLKYNCHSLSLKKGVLKQVSAFVGSIICINSLSCQESFASLSYKIHSDNYKNVIVNSPSDDFWYPPFMIGTWKTSLTFRGVQFSNNIDPSKLIGENAIPGIEKYSIAFLPDIGTNLNNVRMQYVQLDSHPRENHPFNMRQLMQSSSKDTVVESAPYYFQKAPDWFHSMSNNWNIKYHDSSGQGTIHLETRKRFIETFAGSVETFELFHQTHDRQDFKNSMEPSLSSTPASSGSSGTGISISDKESDRISSRKVSRSSDYALNWKLAVPAALRDEFINVEDLSRSSTVQGELNVLAYVSPDHPLYSLVPATPAAVFTYAVSMERLDSPNVFAGSDKVVAGAYDRHNRKQPSRTSQRAGIEENRKDTSRSEISSSDVNTDGHDDERSGFDGNVPNFVYPFVWRGEGPIDDLSAYFGTNE